MIIGKVEERGKVLLLVSISVSAVLEEKGARSRCDTTTEMDTLKIINNILHLKSKIQSCYTSCNILHLSLRL